MSRRVSLTCAAVRNLQTVPEWRPRPAGHRPERRQHRGVDPNASSTLTRVAVARGSGVPTP